MQCSAVVFALSEELLLNPDFQADDSGISILALKVLSKIFWEYHHYKRNMLDSTGQPANEN